MGLRMVNVDRNM